MKHYLLLLMLCTGLVSQAQIPCGTDEMHRQLFQQHPEYNTGIQRASDELEQFTRQFLSNPQLKSGALYVIPVVFHVIHTHGPENISDAQILDAVNQVNLQLRKLNPDTNEIVAAFQPIAADVQIEIRLAQIDPDGNCTNGITRTVSPLTHTGDHAVKSLIHWPPESYLNIYVCAEAAGLAGHALLPAAADSIPEWDGIVMQHSYVGTIGTSDYFRRTVLTHEIGHYLNLQHIWGGNNVPDFPYLPVGNAGNCAYDDEVSDTPNTIGWSTCNLNAQSCGSLDNVQNYMDYAYCARMFTEGQKQRMHATLNAPIAHRNNLWQPANLVATGTDNWSQSLCEALFRAEKTVVCVGEPVLFTDQSFHGVTTRLWAFEGGSAADLTNDSALVTYPSAGNYAVTLTVSDGINTLSTTWDDYITVIPATGSQQGLIEGFESETTFYNDWIEEPSADTAGWTFTSPGYASPQSISVVNSPNGKHVRYAFHSQPIDAEGLGTLAISYDWAYAQRTSNDADLFRVYISNNCGNTWQVRKTYGGMNTLPSVADTLATAFVPIGQNEWNSDTIFVNGAVNLTDHLMLRFAFESDGGNHFFLDNIRIGHPDVLGIWPGKTLQPEIFPNPAADRITIRWSETGSVDKLLLVDATGQVVLQQAVSAHLQETELDCSQLSSGYYFICLEGAHGLRRIPQVIRH